jgi:hypothetical protein
MRRFWCECGATVEGKVEFRGGHYECEFFDSSDLAPTDNCPSCNEPLYPMFVEGTLSDTPPARRPLNLVRSST